MLQLIKPSVKYKQEFEEYINAFIDGTKPHGAGAYRDTYESFAEYLKKINNQKEGIGVNVASTTYWLMIGKKVVGTLNLRHELNDFLLKEGGHIGYSIHPDFRGQGYGTEILRLGLIKARDKGIQKALVTCYDDNIGSEKVILANGGVHENTIKGIKRYWIEND